jgi:hypothetical protein
MERQYDQQFRVVFEAIKQLLEIKGKPKRKIGFEVKEGKTSSSKRTKGK